MPTPEEVRRRFAGTPLYPLLGIALVEIEPDRVVAAMTAAAVHCNIDGVVHGGLYGLLADTAMGCAARTGQSAGSRNKTLEMSVDFFAGAAAGDRLRVEGVVTARAGRFAWAEATVTAAPGDEPPRPIGRARSLNYEVPSG
jgi:uncharacterized protein (TIGR00369 family)